LVFILGPAFYFLYLLVPPEFAISQAAAESGVTDVDRFAGLPAACTAIVCFLCVRYGIKGILDWQKPWRMLLFGATLVAVGFGGFRSVYVLIALICVIQFFLEGLHRTVFLPISMGLAIVILALVIVFAGKLPLSVQRAVSFLPVKIDSGVAADAEGSWEWRLNMWTTLVPDIPKYFFVGKGYRIDPEDLYLADVASQMGLTDSFEASRVAGDYHSGPLSLIISFGIFGVLGFIWVLSAGTKVLFRNYRHGPAALHGINTFLLAFFLAHAIHFIAVFGDIRSDLFIFTGVLGMSVSLNGGVSKKPARRSMMGATQLVAQPA
jgi:O-antigen ligase